ncbi:hypothetical protein GLOTRDRAFT_127243 [Gloeophyllum trabeum ATCC 11539]|uniref:Uncharacterized protein n=1 Tax=Gloeophyllum trabeum (strain ATCC 11539 / FP-39264 / Madison 617) TaxID=670483 RepID=S7QBW5_GLOTA|nr:uncharacterized protein GLOTRDRAFT_127243 [Gloeophyllum trabeum ATCC 11539]EPQ56848.1 hypothetical protein GLOTRDRAFT_127243 [Gloeophyllum trabeum ATCC 11539]
MDILLQAAELIARNEAEEGEFQDAPGGLPTPSTRRGSRNNAVDPHPQPERSITPGFLYAQAHHSLGEPMPSIPPWMTGGRWTVFHPEVQQWLNVCREVPLIKGNESIERMEEDLKQLPPPPQDQRLFALAALEVLRTPRWLAHWKVWHISVRSTTLECVLRELTLDRILNPTSGIEVNDISSLVNHQISRSQGLAPVSWYMESTDVRKTSTKKRGAVAEEETESKSVAPPKKRQKELQAPKRRSSRLAKGASIAEEQPALSNPPTDGDEEEPIAAISVADAPVGPDAFGTSGPTKENVPPSSQSADQAPRQEEDAQPSSPPVSQHKSDPKVQHSRPVKPLSTLGGRTVRLVPPVGESAPSAKKVADSSSEIALARKASETGESAAVEKGVQDQPASKPKEVKKGRKKEVPGPPPTVTDKAEEGHQVALQPEVEAEPNEKLQITKGGSGTKRSGNKKSKAPPVEKACAEEGGIVQKDTSAAEEPEPPKLAGKAPTKAKRGGKKAGPAENSTAPRNTAAGQVAAEPSQASDVKQNKRSRAASTKKKHGQGATARRRVKSDQSEQQTEGDAPVPSSSSLAVATELPLDSTTGGSRPRRSKTPSQRLLDAQKGARK